MSKWITTLIIPILLAATIVVAVGRMIELRECRKERDEAIAQISECRETADALRIDRDKAIAAAHMALDAFERLEVLYHSKPDVKLREVPVSNARILMEAGQFHSSPYRNEAGPTVATNGRNQ